MKIKLPFYAMFTLVLLGIWLFLYGIFLGQDILIPLGFSFLIAVLLQPLEKLLERMKVPRVLAILLCLIVAVGVLFGLFSVLSYQVKQFMSDLPEVEKNLAGFVDKTQIWINDKFHVSQQQQQQAIQNARKSGTGNLTAVAGTTLGFVGSSLALIGLIPIYVFLLMYYRKHLIMFVIQCFEDKHSAMVQQVVSKVRYVVQKYVSGLVIETTCVAVLNCIGLLIIGAPYAILLGIIGAILNLIPYIGGLIAIILTAIVTLSNTGDVTVTLLSIVVYFVVQFIDNNFLVPRIIGSSVQLNALVSILAVLIGGTLCSVGGMFLSLPFIAICKVIFDHVPDLQPWGKVLGDEESARWRIMKVTIKKPQIKSAS